MKTPPTIQEIQKWLIQENPLGVFTTEDFTVKNIDPKPWSGHFNFLVFTENKKYVLRFKGPEWGEPKGIVDEYEMLIAVGKYKVAPQALYLSKDFFGEPMMLQEYVEGIMFSDIDEKGQKELFTHVSHFIAEINSIKLSTELLAKQEQLMGYEQNKKIWRERLKIILGNPHTKEWGERVKEILSQAEAMLDTFENRLKKVFEKSGPVFVFKSAHAGHLIKTEDGFRFFNWEKNGYGDPSFSLSVFLSSCCFY